MLPHAALSLSYFGTGSGRLSPIRNECFVLRLLEWRQQRLDCRLRSEAAMELRLTLQEEQLVAEVLRQYQRELRLEISHTDHHEFKSKLRERAQLLEGVLEKLGVSQFAAN